MKYHNYVVKFHKCIELKMHKGIHTLDSISALVVSS